MVSHMKDKNENRKGYKETKVGWIPEEWTATELRESCSKIGSGITPRGGEATYLTAGVGIEYFHMLYGLI